MEDRGKIKLVKIEKEERERGRGFMKRLKSQWDVEFPDQAGLSPQCLRDNAARCGLVQFNAGQRRGT